MQEQQQPTTEIVHLPSGGSIPGIPGTHGAGRYVVDWIERTIAPVVDAVESAAEHAEEAIHPEEPVPAPDAPAESAPPESVGESAPVEEQSAN